MTEYISTSDFESKLRQKLREAGVIRDRASGYSNWEEVKIEKDKIMSALEKLLEVI
jgi:hypothetical protein